MGYEREYPGRVSIANQQLADSFVRALKLRENEVVIEAFPGLGVLTRSLLSGGTAAEEAKDEELRTEWWEKAGHLAPKDELKLAEGFPSWIRQIQPEESKLEGPLDSEAESEGSGTGKRKVGRKSRAKPKEPVAEEEYNEALSRLPPTNKPKLVIAIDANERATHAGLGIEHPKLPSKFTSWETLLNSENAEQEEAYFTPLQKSPYEERLVAGPVDPFAWESARYTLSHPLVKDHLEKVDPSAKTAERAWTDTAPPITYVASMPNSNVGELLSLQWLHSAVGAAEGKPSFLCRWGRVRIAMLVTYAQYDVRLAKALRATANVSVYVLKREKCLGVNQVS